ncbi:hypothetical protein ACFL5Q_04340 [Planctomycetota bacterium]
MPPVVVQCPGCQTKLRLEGDRPQGKPIKCPKCGRSFTPTIPPVVVKCPGCQTKLGLKGDPPQGKPIKCPKCGQSFRVGKAASAKPREDPSPKQEEPDGGSLAALDAAVNSEDHSSAGKPVLLRPKAAKSEKKTQRSGKKKTQRSGKKPKKRDGPAFPWLQVSVIGGACVSFVVAGIIGFIMFRPLATVGVGSSGTSETPTEFVEVEFGQRDYQCECPKGWEVTSGGGKDGIPPWTKFEKGGASVQIRDSLSGTPGGMLDRSLHLGTAVDRGEAPVDQVHEHRIEGVAGSMRNYEESARQKLDHKLGDALIAEFTSKPMFAEAIRGYHATVLHEFHQFTIACRCTESEWETLKPAFEHVISTLEPVKSDDMPGI